VTCVDRDSEPDAVWKQPPQAEAGRLALSDALAKAADIATVMAIVRIGHLDCSERHGAHRDVPL
jgi:hypothetical protein